MEEVEWVGVLLGGRDDVDTHSLDAPTLTRLLNIATEEDKDRPTSEQRLNDARLMNASGWELEN